MEGVSQSQFPAGMEYLAADPHAAAFLDLAQQLRTVNEQADLGTEAHQLGVANVIAQAREVGIPDGHLGRISVLALSTEQTEGNN